jgi:excisionase family DNA binding protein
MSAFCLLKDILSQMAEGSAVSVIPHHTELTTQQAAELLGVSRPFLVEQLDKGLLPHRKVGTHRRVLLKDLLAYKQRSSDERLRTLEKLSALDQELDLGY